MEPLTIASTFASVVSLLNIWKSERASSKQQTVDDFVEWLRRHEFGQLADSLNENSSALESIQDILASNHGELTQKLDAIAAVVTNLAARMQEFQPLALVFDAKSHISEQALGILRQMNEKETSGVLESRTLSGTALICLDGHRGSLEVCEQRFLDDDLQTLCEFNLLRQDYSRGGERIFRITREGATLGAP